MVCGDWLQLEYLVGHVCALNYSSYYSMTSHRIESSYRVFVLREALEAKEAGSLEAAAELTKHPRG